MKLKSFSIAIVGASLAALTVGLAGPASADPAGVTTIAGGGSDTIQDVMNAIASNIGGTTVGSWDAVKPGTSPAVAHDLIKTKNTTACTSIARPNGSGEGVTALRRSLSGTTVVDGATTTATYNGGTANPPLGSNCFDFARSSSGPGTNASTAGELQYVPFALDGVTVAVGSTTNITDSFTEAQLQTLYGKGNAVTLSNGHSYFPKGGSGTVPTGAKTIDLYAPQAGSGTRNFFLGVMGLTAAQIASLPAWIKDTYTSGSSTLPVEEHDGSVLAADANGLAPFSTAQWLGQSHGHNDRRHGAVLQSINGVSPTSGTGTSAVLNTSFPSDFLREVYNVIPFKDTTSAAPNTTIYNVFVNTASPLNVCKRSSIITDYGFATLASAPKGRTCGQVATTLRAYSTAQF